MLRGQRLRGVQDILQTLGKERPILLLHSIVLRFQQWHE